MKKILLSSIFIMFLLFSFCSQKSKTIPVTSDQMLEIALYKGLYHFQSDTERDIIKKNKIKSASFVKEIISKNIIDSTTFLQYNRNGQIINRTTTECTTIGCLPYIIRQEFIYSDDKIKQMNDYTFKYKSKSILENWLLNDISKLSKFDWEDYTYIDDTIAVESATQNWKYVKNSKGQLISDDLYIKTSNQYRKILYEYSDSTITINVTHALTATTTKQTYYIADHNKVISKIKLSDNKIYKQVYIFNSLGLLEEVLNYKSGDLINKTMITYSFFND